MKVDRALVDRLDSEVVGRRRELEVLVAALAADRHMLLEGPPGTGKSTVLRSLADATGAEFVFVEGNAELTPSRFVGTFDPAQVLADGYAPEAFVDGPLITALRDGALLYVEEINRVPEETLNVLITVMSEGELHVPRLGRVGAAEGFRLVAAMNPFDSVGTARISAAIYDRMCRVTMGYQDAATETRVVLREVPGADPEFAAKVVNVVRGHPDPSRRAHRLVGARGHRPGAAGRRAGGAAGDAARPTTRTGLDAALAALSGRLRVYEGGEHHGRRHRARAVGRRLRPPPGEARATREKADAPGQGGVLHAGPRRSRATRPWSGSTRSSAARRSRRELENGRRTSTRCHPRSACSTRTPSTRRWPRTPTARSTLLAALIGATDEKLAEAARRLAARVVLDVTRAGAAAVDRGGAHRAPPGRPGRRRPRPRRQPRAAAAGPGRRDGRPARRAAGVGLGPAVDGALPGRRPQRLDERRRAWRPPRWRPRRARGGPASDYSVVAFSNDVVVVKSQDAARRAEEVADDVLRLRGHGTTDLALALRTARGQLERSRAQRRVTILLSDCRPTTGGDPVAAAARLDELCIIAPADDADDAGRTGSGHRRPLGDRRRALHHPRRRSPACWTRDPLLLLVSRPAIWTISHLWCAVSSRLPDGCGGGRALGMRA